MVNRNETAAFLQLTAKRHLFRRVGRPSQDLSEPEWPRVAQELKRKGVTLTLLWQEYRMVHRDGYGYTCSARGLLPISDCQIGSKARPRPSAYFGGVPKAIVLDLKAGVVKALLFEPTLNQTFAAMAEHYDTTILPTRSRTC